MAGRRKKPRKKAPSKDEVGTTPDDPGNEPEPELGEDTGTEELDEQEEDEKPPPRPDFAPPPEDTEEAICPDCSSSEASEHGATDNGSEVEKFYRCRECFRNFSRILTR